MKYIKTSILCSIVCSAFLGQAHAEKITFQGSIAEFSCSKDSIDQDCKVVSGLVETLKNAESTLEVTQILKGVEQKTATFEIQDTDNKDNKVLTVNYF